MPTASTAITSFNAGELSPMLSGRTDFAKYPSGCRTMLDFIPTVQGPAVQRPGTRFVAEVKDSTKKTWLVRFEYNTTNAYILEFGDLYVRFYTQHGQLQSAGVPVEVATPYTLASLFNSDGTCRLRVAQSGDFLYIFHGDYEPRILQRTSATSFTLTTYRPAGGPFKDTDPTTATTVYASAETGSGITLTASASIFQAGHVGALFLLESKSQNSVKAWEAGKAIGLIGDLRRVSNRVYAALNAATTGTATPVHTTGSLYDGDTGVQWEFKDAGYGYVRITGYTSGTLVTADVVSRLPSDVVGAPNATTRWAHGSWSSVEGWPTDVAFFRERLVAARRSQIWMSVSSDFSDFSARNPAGDVSADQAIALTVASGEINDIQWLIPAKDLLAGTAGGEFSIGELTNGEPIGPTNIRVRPQSRFGSRSMVPVQAGAAVLFVQRSGKKVREISYDFASDGYQSTDRTALSEHVTGPGLIDMDYTQEPFSVVWCVRSDGQLVGFTWNAEQNVWGWHPHAIGGTGTVVESVASIPSPDGASNELWLAVSRTINGTTKRYIEYMEKAWDETQAQSSAFYVDCGLSYNGATATTISGLSHLEGQAVSILADGSTHPARVVSGGAITLQRPASIVHVGLAQSARLSPMRIEAGSANGTAQGKTKRIHKIVMRFIATSTGKFGRSLDSLDEITFRSQSDPMNAPVPPFTGDKVLSFPGGYDTDGFVWYVNDKPLPATLAAIYPQIQTQDAR